MSIEKNLERIADALEILAGSKPPAKPAATPTPKEEKSTAAPPAAEAAEPEVEDTTGEDGVTKEVLRAALATYQEEHGLDKTKELIEPFGASIGKIKAKDYPKVIAAIEEA